MVLRYILTIALAIAMGAAPARADDRGLLEKTQSWLDDVGQGMRKVGEKAGGLFGPGLDIGQEKEAAYTVERDFSDQRETGPSPLVNVSNEFGEIHVDTWEDRVVQISAKVIVGAESASVAEEMSRAVNVSISGQDGGVYIRPIFPDHHRDLGAISMQVNLYITAPRNAQVVSENFFGDTYIRGVDGLVALESQYGIVDLADLGGTVSARLRGEFPVRVIGLQQGGQFQLHGSDAHFGQIGGALRVNAFGGRVTAGTLKENAELDVASESTAITVILEPGSTPDLTALTRYGTVDSELPLTRSEQGQHILARHGSPEANQRIDISGTFSDIRILYEGEGGGAASRADSADKPISETVRENVVVTPYTKIAVEGIVGDIQLEGTDEPGVQIAATSMVWVEQPSATKARAALEAIALRIEQDKAADRLVIRTVLTADMESLSCSRYRVDLVIRYPRHLPLTAYAEDGHTQVSGNVAPVEVQQTTGAISAQRSAGPLKLTNKNGGIRVVGGTGAVTAWARYGDTHFERVRGDLSVNLVQGNTIIDSPGAGVTVRNNLGNVRILALKGVAGNYDVLVEEGDLSLVLGTLPSANLKLAVDGGTVDSAFPMPGQILGRRKEEFQNYVGDEAYSMQLEVRNGDIVLD